ncbi:hypothetical protein I6N91_15975 [Arthrobacter sp. MSA 4-2]|uniref:hypothetical protein n=1 Tax=Arthrobacter sp. MSA 4-2 TaxID=2794349 RepID=UPI0018E75029|nr:hypothetical protein [Arthrobacter sp. MSA 4-2]MBJ2122479.1 hypothetical protein [Arthrobacter sp. MSA 4-2]
MIVRGVVFLNQVLRAVILVAGVAGTVVTIVEFIKFVHAAPLPGLLPGASGPGNFIAVAGGLTIAFFAALQFFLVRRGHRWAYGFSVPIWIIIWQMARRLPFSSPGSSRGGTRQ